MLRTILMLLSALLLMSCASKPDGGSAPEPEGPLPLPSTFSGELDCEDCFGIEATLVLRQDQLYLLRISHGSRENRGDTEVSMGRFKLTENGEILILGSHRGGLGTFAVKAPDHLRLLGIENEELEGERYDLWRQPDPAPFTDPVRMRGMFRYRGDAATLVECFSRKEFPVLRDGGSYIQMEEAYLNTPHGQYDPLLVSFTGSFEETGDFDEPLRETIRVAAFTRVYPDVDCDGARTSLSLTGTTWQLIEVQGEAVAESEGLQVPFLLLDSEGNRMQGFGGCNRFFGTYLLRGEVFVFNKMAGTRMACSAGAVVEDRFFRAMGMTEAHRIEDGILLLLDRNGDVVARLRGMN